MNKTEQEKVNVDNNRETVGIVTIDGYTNYGNRLQNYALTKLLETCDCKVINGIRVFTKEDWVNRSKNPIKRFIKRLYPYRSFKLRLSCVPKIEDELLLKRKKRFCLFMEEYTEVLHPIVSKTNKQAYDKLADYDIGCFVTGSDQVWNPYYEAKGYEFLTFAPNEKRLSFSASIGVSTIPEEFKWYFKNNLLNMKYISVREERAAEIVKELTGRTADVTLDPTLLLDKADWEHITKKPELEIKEKYICTYFLGEVPEAVKAFAKEKDLSVYALNSLERPELYTLDPAEFLYMIQNASYVMTDSFHAVAFSIKFNKEFYVFDRKQDGVSSMFSRIETITKRFGLENRIQSRDRIIEQEPVSNWKDIEKELETEKKESMRKLLRAMGM